jgi:signal transduction histidine kinase
VRIPSSVSARIVWATDGAGRVLADVPSWREWTGQPRADWLALGFWPHLHPDDAVTARATFDRALATRETWELECRLRLADDTWADVIACAAPMLGEDGGVREWVGAFVDVTERKVFTREREELLERAEAARADAEAANRSKDDFLATLSHEMRTPLSAMLGWAQLLRSGRLEESARAHALETIERNARVQVQLVEDILDVSRIVAGKLRLHFHATDLRAVSEVAVDAVRPAADAKQIDLHVRLDAGPVPVWGDANRLEQVAWNLLTNAIKFTPRGGRVELEVRRDLHAVLCVRDDGRGITGEFLPHVFDRFRQADAGITRAYGGLGLGLAIVRHLVELHGGSVRADSEGADRGATFTVMLPVRAQPGDSGEFLDEPTLHDAPPSLTGVRVLLVEDEPDTRELLQVVLKQSGADVRVASCAPEALEVLGGWEPNVMVSDIGLPGVNGYELIRRVREHGRAGPPAVALTAYAGDDDNQRALDAGYQLHVAKPIDPDELISVVARVSGWGNGRR